MKYLLFPLAFLICSCGSVQRKAPRFDKPSTVPLHKAADTASGRIKDAQADAKKIEDACPEAKEVVLRLQLNLTEAATAIFILQGALQSHDIQLEQQTTKANVLADNYDKAGAEITSLHESRHKWVRSTWLSLALNLGLLAWIFRKPILLLCGL